MVQARELLKGFDGTMFHTIPAQMRERMQALEARDAQDRADGTPRMQRLRQIPPVTGKFLALLCASAPKGGVLEVGTSGGYSSLWLSLACQACFSAHQSSIPTFFSKLLLSAVPVSSSLLNRLNWGISISASSAVSLALGMGDV